jgi:hypothetical protein
MILRWLFCVISLSVIVNAATATTFFGCINHVTYVCPQIGGEVHCYQTTLSCNFRHVLYVNRAAIPQTPGFTHTGSISDRNAAEILRISARLRESDLHFYFGATEAVFTSWLRRARVSPEGKVEVSERRLPAWLLAGMSSGEFLSGALEKRSCSEGFYPKQKPGGGRKCYPCLGCAPCGKEYCSIYKARLTTADLSPQLAKRGYTVKNNRLQVPKSP